MGKWWRNNPRTVGFVAHWLLRGLSLTLQIKVHKHVNIDPNKPYLFAFWHGKQLLPSLVLINEHNTQKCVMVSPSRDGAILVAYLKLFGYEILRGSSRDNNIAALINIKNKIKQGASIGFGMDGPIGPRHIVKPGIAYLAQNYNIPIIPMGSAFNRAWIFEKAWDKFQLPKPFAKAALVLGKPYVVQKDMDLQQTCLEIARLTQEAEQQAMDLTR